MKRETEREREREGGRNRTNAEMQTIRKIE